MPIRIQVGDCFCDLLNERSMRCELLNPNQP